MALVPVVLLCLNWDLLAPNFIKTTDGFQMMHNAWCSKEEVPCCFSRSCLKFKGYIGKKFNDFNPILGKITRPVAAIKSLRFALFFCEIDSFEVQKRVQINELQLQCYYVLHSGAIVMHCSIWYYMQYCNESGSTYRLHFELTEDTPNLSHVQGMGCLSWGFGHKNLLPYIYITVHVFVHKKS